MQVARAIMRHNILQGFGHSIAQTRCAGSEFERARQDSPAAAERATELGACRGGWHDAQCGDDL